MDKAKKMEMMKKMMMAKNPTGVSVTQVEIRPKSERVSLKPVMAPGKDRDTIDKEFYKDYDDKGKKKIIKNMKKKKGKSKAMKSEDYIKKHPIFGKMLGY